MLAQMLATYAINDRDLYRRSATPCVENLARKTRKGIYDHDLAGKLWKYHADRCAQKYHEEHVGAGKWYDLLDAPTRRSAARIMADHYLSEVECRAKELEGKPSKG